MTLNPKKRRWIQIGIIVGFVALIVILYLLRSVLWPFIFAFFIAYILNPWINFLERKGIRRTLAILVVMIFFSLLVTLGAWLIIPQAGREFADFAKNVPRYAQVVRSHVEPWVQGLMERYPDLALQIEEYYNISLKPKLPALAKPVLDFFGKMFSGVVNFLVVLLNLALVPVLAFYLMHDFGNILAKGLEMIPPRSRETVVTRIREVDDALSQYLRGQLSVSLFLAVIYIIGLLVLRVPLAVPIGLFSGLANMVPYLGFVLGIGASIFFSFVDNQDWHRLIWIVALYAFAQLLEGTVVSPLFVGKRTGLHPVVIMLALVIGGTLFGFMGMLLAVPFMAIATVFLKSAYNAYINSPWYQQQKQLEKTPVI
ncbi:AI-2E family transporter [bacterium]|nr:AI-2E family transporter [bacterium]